MFTIYSVHSLDKTVLPLFFSCIHMQIESARVFSPASERSHKTHFHSCFSHSLQFLQAISPLFTSLFPSLVAVSDNYFQTSVPMGELLSSKDAFIKKKIKKNPTSASEASRRSQERREQWQIYLHWDRLCPKWDDRNKIKEDKRKRRAVVNQLEELLITCMSLAYGIHLSNGSHQYFEALLMSFIWFNRSECPCLLATITLRRANPPMHMLTGTAEETQ